MQNKKEAKKGKRKPEGKTRNKERETDPGDAHRRGAGVLFTWRRVCLFPVWECQDIVLLYTTQHLYTCLYIYILIYSL